MKKFLAILLFLFLPLLTFSQEKDEIFTIKVPVERAGDALLMWDGQAELSCYRNYCQITTGDKYIAQSLKIMGIAKDDDLYVPDAKLIKTKKTTALSMDSVIPDIGYMATIPGYLATDALRIGGGNIALSCFGASCQLTTDNESIMQNMVVMGVATSYIEDILIPIPETKTDVLDLNDQNIKLSPLGINLFSATPPNDPYLSDQWGLTDYHFGWLYGWELMQSVSSNRNKFKIAVVDTGYQPHADHFNTVNCYKNGSTTLQTCTDIQGHGTHVQGIANALTDNALGVASTGYGKSGVVSYNVKYNSDPLDNSLSSTYINNSLSLINLNASTISVVNMSYGSTGSNSTTNNLIAELKNNGIIAVASAGNENSDIGVNKRYPVSYAQDNIIGVLNLTSSIMRSGSSNYGGRTDIAAPGTNIYSFGLLGNNYVSLSGTSMSAPYVTGAIAAAKQLGPDVTGPQIVQLLYSTAAREDNMTGFVRNRKVINLERFLKAVKACQGNDNAAGCKVPNTWPVRYEMNNAPNPDPDAKPGNWFPPRNIRYVTESWPGYYAGGGTKITIYWDAQPEVVDAYEINFHITGGTAGNTWCICGGGAENGVRIISSDTGEFSTVLPTQAITTLKIRSIQHNSHISNSATVYSDYINVVM
jgi:hypothetical protein